jgi:hypothetical protein
MRALSVRQPWAHAILHLGKDVENRPKPNWAHLNERVLIQASLTVTDDERDAAKKLKLDIKELRRGYIVGSVEIVCCVDNSKSKWAIKGQWHWILENPRVLAKPILFKGALGFIKVPPKLLKNARFLKPKPLKKK